MGVMDKLINAMKFNDDLYDEEIGDGGNDYPHDSNDYYGSAPDEENPGMENEVDDMGEYDNVNASTSSRRHAAPDRGEQASQGRTVVKRQYSESGMEVYVARPNSVNDARDVTDVILSGSTVVLNLEGLDVDIAQRILDFISGSSYAVQGNVMKISHYIFVVTPSTVPISGDISTASGADQDGSASLEMPYMGA